MVDGPSPTRFAVGAACAIFDRQGRVLLVHHTYGRLNWELPGGAAEPGEAPYETAARELLEETGLRADVAHLSGVYLEPGHDFGPMLHFVFRSEAKDGLDPTPSSPEVSEACYWPLDQLPTPISDFTERRIADAFTVGPARVGRVDSRTCRA